MKQRAKLTAGRGWISLLNGQRSRPEAPDRQDLSTLRGDPLRRAADARVRAINDAMKSSDSRRARTVLNETMYLLRRAKDLPGDDARRSTMEKIIAWLHAQGR